MDYLKVFLSSILSLAVLFISAKVIGNKQMSQLNMFDYINGITIGSIAADMAVHTESNILYPIIAIAVYTVIIFIITYVGSKNMTLRRFLNGRSIILMDKGKIYNNNFKTAKIDLNEFLTQCRINGFFNLNDIETAVLEQNGMISIMPKSCSRPANCSDINAPVSPERPFYSVVADGNILNVNFEQSQMTHEKLNAELKARGIELKDVYLAVYDGKSFYLYPKTQEAPKNDFSQ